ncbi:MAG: RNA polymerase sigma factor [Gammaproteobacteria bacterium]
MRASLSKHELYNVFIASQQALHRFFTRYLGCPESASDLIQDLYLRLDRGLPVCNAEQARAWLFRVAANLARDHAKLRRRREVLLEEAWIDRTAYTTPTPEDMVLRREQILALQQALAELPSRCAEVLLLSRVEGFTHEEIATRLGISKSLVEKYVIRALNHCRRRLNIQGE